MKKSGLRWKALVGLTAAVLAAAGCSSSSGSGSGGTNSSLEQGAVPSNGKPAPTGTPIKIGIVYGTGASVGNNEKPAADVGAAWAEWVNTDMGGVNGHPVEVVTAAHDSTGASANAAVRRLVEQDQVQAVYMFGSVALGAALTYLSGTGVPMIGGNASGGDLVGIPGAEAWPNDWFPYDTTTRALIASSSLAADASGASSVLYATCSESVTCEGAGAFVEESAPAYGVEYKGTVGLAAGQATYTPQCLQVKESGAEAVEVAPFPQAIVPFLTQCAQQGVTATPLLFSTQIDPPTQADIPGTLYVSNPSFPWWVNEQPVIDFRAVMEKYAPDADYRYHASANAWQSLELFRTAMEASGPAATAAVVPADVTAAYHQIKDETLDGLLAQPITYSETGSQPAVTCMWLNKYTPSASDENMFEEIPNPGTSGNGISGALSTWCVDS